MKRTLPLLTLLLMVSLASNAQFKFYRTDSIPVIQAGDTLKYAWAGGLNQPKFSTIDLNFDGIKDLFVFDRTNDQVLTFINKGTPGQIDYVYDPSYEKYFPRLPSWMLLRDYNCDGMEDIFAWYPGGFQIWKNISDTVIKFEKKVQLLRDQQCSSTFLNNVYALSVDIPSVEDMDGDGDLDILTFDQFAIYVEYHRNYSVENGHGCDSLSYFKLKNACWGHFSEDNDSCYVKLNDVCTNCPLIGGAELTPYTPGPGHVETMDIIPGAERSGTRHSGSSLLAIDLNGNNTKDLLMGDVSCNNLYMLMNGGTTPNTNSPMVSVDNTFPSYDTPVNMFTFPAPFYLDVNNDGVRDLIVATNEPSLTNTHSGVWLYKNNGADNTPVFNLTEQGFMQNQMIERGEGAFPVFLDYDNDGLQDLVVANFGFFNLDSMGHVANMALYHNTGTAAQAAFTLVDPNFAGIANIINIPSSYPAFADLDNDGDQDMILGDGEGNLHYFVNNAGPGAIPDLDLVTLNMTDVSMTVIDVGRFATPVLADMDRDGDFDLVIGEYSANLNYYENIGTTSAPVFKFITDHFGNVDVSEWWSPIGYSVPALYDANGEWFMAVGSQKGVVYTYTNIDGNLGGAFTLSDSLFHDAPIGGRVAPALAKLNSDNNPDLVVGNYRGGLALCYAESEVDTTIGMSEHPAQNISFQLYPNPAGQIITLRTNLPGTYDYKLTDLEGRLVMQGHFNGLEQSIDISSLEKGVYFVTLQNINIRTTRRLIKLGESR